MIKVRAIEVPDLYYSFRNNNGGDKLVGLGMNAQEELATLYLYNPKTRDLETLYSCPNGYHITNSASDPYWIVWVESNEEYDFGGTEAYNWSMKAMNVADRRIHEVDAGITPKRSDVLGFRYIPDEMSISLNKLIYCKTLVEDRNQTASQVICYMLDSQVGEVIQAIDYVDVSEEWLKECSIYNNKVVWCKMSICNDDNDFRMSHYKYADIYLYDCDTRQVEQLTSGDYYFNPFLFEDKLALIRMPQTRPDQYVGDGEVAFMDLKTRDIEIVADRYSNFYETNIIGEDIARGFPIINARYISWSNTFPNRNLVDYHNNKMVALELVDFNWVPQDPTRADEYEINIVCLYDDAVLIQVNYTGENTSSYDYESLTKTFYVELP
ncbi:MAG: hypothetical protein FWG40_04885 [Peptococcaceae bacterium]|nr:hypothetical protein [Peptococcaceae bacterium]